MGNAQGAPTDAAPNNKKFLASSESAKSMSSMTSLSSTSSTNSTSDTNSSSENSSTVGVLTSVEIPFEEIFLEERLGTQGWDSSVFKGHFRGQDVVVKKFALENLVDLDLSFEDIQSTIAQIAQLSQHENIVSFIGACTVAPNFALLFEYIGSNLHDIIFAKGTNASPKFSLLDKLIICKKVASAMEFLHSQQFCHGKLSTKTVMLPNSRNSDSASMNVKISISTILRENQDQIWNSASPERIQTGEIRKPGDVYSFAILMYELLTESLAYSDLPEGRENAHLRVVKDPDFRPNLSKFTSDSMDDTTQQHFVDLIKDCWAHDPALRPNFEEICALLTDLIDHAKNPLHVSRFGSVQRQRHKAVFVIDRSEIFGRDIELHTIKDMFSQAQRNKVAGKDICRCLIVTGPPGVGKTSFIRKLVNSLTETLSKDTFSFCSGRFPQPNNGSVASPFSAILQAFSPFIQSKIILPSEKNPHAARVWRTTLAKACGRNIQFILDLFPELEKVVGQQRLLIETPSPSPENHNRFWPVFSAFLDVLAHSRHKIILFLDDMQWSDASSTEMLCRILANPHIFVILAFRDAEVKPGHHLLKALEEIRSHVKTHSVALEAPSLRDMNKVCARTLRVLSEQQTMPLSEYIYTHSSGNPQMFVHVLSLLAKQRLIHFDTNSNEWTWDLEEIRRKSINFSDIVTLMSTKLRTLSHKSQLILQVASVLGNVFEFRLLRAVCSSIVIPGAEGKMLNSIGNSITESDLDECISENLLYVHQRSTVTAPVVKSKGNNITQRVWYAFSHSRIQQAAMALWQDWDRVQATVQLQIGRIIKSLYLDNNSHMADNTMMFEATSRMNAGSDLLSTKSELLDLVGMNVQAAHQAMKSTAFDKALLCAHAAHNLLHVRIKDILVVRAAQNNINISDLEAIVWTDSECYSLAFSVALVCQRLEYITNTLEAGDRHFEMIRKFAKKESNENLVALTRAYCARSDTMESRMLIAKSFEMLLSFIEFESRDPRIRDKFVPGFRAVNDAVIEEMYKSAVAQFKRHNFEQISKASILSSSDCEQCSPELLILLRMVTSAITRPINELSFLILQTIEHFLLHPISQSEQGQETRPVFPSGIFMCLSGLSLIMVQKFRDFEGARRVAQEMQRHSALAQIPSSMVTWVYVTFSLVCPLKTLLNLVMKSQLAQALAQGDLHTAARFTSVAVMGSYYSSKNIPGLLKVGQSIRSMFEAAGGIPMFAATSLNALSGYAALQENGLTAAAIEERERFIQAAPVSMTKSLNFFIDAYVNYILGDFPRAHDLVRTGISNIPPSGKTLHDIAFASVIECITMCRDSRIAQDEAIKAIDTRIFPQLQLFYARAHADNFGFHFWLASAERARINGTEPAESIIKMYQKCIEYARLNELLLLEILGQEAFLNYLVDIKSPLIKSAAFSAFENFRIFGATKKLAQMRANPIFGADIASNEAEERKAMVQTLLSAISCSDSRTVRKVLATQEGRDLVASYVSNPDKSTMLHKAAIATGSHSGKILKMVLKRAGSTLNAFDANRSSAVHCAASIGNAPAISTILRFIQQQSGNGDSDVKTILNSRDSYGYCPLHLALRRDAAQGTSSLLETAQVLLLYGGDPNLKMSNGDTALHLACDPGAERFEIVEFLLRQPGIKLNVKDREGETALLRAARNKHIRTVEMMLTTTITKHEADSSSLTELLSVRGQNLLHIAAMRDDADLLRLTHKFATCAVSVSTPSATGKAQKPQQEQCVCSVPLWLKLLCFDHESAQQRTAMHIAIESNSIEFLQVVQEILTPLSANPSQLPSQIRSEIVTIADAAGNTLLHTALSKKNVALAQWLFRVCVVAGHGAGMVSPAAETAMHIKNKQGRTPTELCRQLQVVWSTTWV